jgi:hypothetical protein
MCGEDGCRIILKGRRIGYTDNPLLFAQECQEVDILLSPIPVKIPCRARIVDLYDVKDQGAHGIWLGGKETVIRTAEQGRGMRPWSSLNAIFKSAF